MGKVDEALVTKGIELVGLAVGAAIVVNAALAIVGGTLIDLIGLI